MPSQDSKPLPFHLARASWVAPLLVILMNLLLKNAGGGGQEGARAVVVTLVATALYSIGFGCGLIALFAVKRHGRKGILIPALVGVALCGALLAVVATNFWSGYRRATDPQARLESVAESLRAELPKRIDEETSLDEVTTEPGRLVYDYSLVNYTSEQIDGRAFGDAMTPELRDQMCGPMRTFFEAGFSVIARYTAADGVLLSEIVVTAADCPTP